MRSKIILLSVLAIVLLALALPFVLRIYMTWMYHPNKRIYYKIYKINGKYYYRNYCAYNGYPGEKIEILFADDWALIQEYAEAMNTRTWKYINKSGRVVLWLNVHRADAFSEGLAAVKRSELSGWGYINKNNNMVVKPLYYQASMFKDGFAYVLPNDENHGWILINKNGEHVQYLDESPNWISQTQIPEHLLPPHDEFGNMLGELPRWRPEK